MELEVTTDQDELRDGIRAVLEREADDPGQVTTTATPAGDGWVLDGEKPWVLEAPAVDRLVVVARIPDTTGDEGPDAFVVSTDAPGVTITPIADFDLTRSAGTVSLQGVTVAAERVRSKSAMGVMVT